MSQLPRKGSLLKLLAPDIARLEAACRCVHRTSQAAGWAHIGLTWRLRRPQDAAQKTKKGGVLQRATKVKLYSYINFTE